MKQTDIAIIGGGIAGLSLAILLGDIGIHVALVEPHPPAPFDKTERNGRTIALMENSINIIKATGIWDKIAPLSHPIETMRVIDNSIASKPPTQSDFPASDIGQDQFGYNIPNAHLRAALYERAQDITSITLHANAALKDIAPLPTNHPRDKDEYKNHAHSSNTNHNRKLSHYVNIILNNESGSEINLQTKLLVGADGRNSKTRELLNIADKQNPYGQTAITCIINHSNAHENISTEFHYPSGPLAIVPLPGNQSSIVWVEQDNRADDIMKLKKTDFTQMLQDKMNSILGGITLEHGPTSWPLTSIKAKTLTAPRTALIAEAAHVLSPITAQGLNLSLRDVAALAELIADNMRVGLDPGSDTLLKTYESRRRFDINTRVFGVDGMNRFVSTKSAPLKELRRAGFKAMDALPPLKTFATKQALAPAIDQSRLAKGEAL